MNLAAFEQYLAEQWAVERSDVYEGGIGASASGWNPAITQPPRQRNAIAASPSRLTETKTRPA